MCIYCSQQGSLSELVIGAWGTQKQVYHQKAFPNIVQNIPL